MDKIKAFNPGPSEKMADREGRIIDAHDWAEVDPTDPVTQRLLRNGGLIVPEEPAQAAESTEAPEEADKDKDKAEKDKAEKDKADKTEDAPADPEKKRGSQKTAAKNGDS
jgi:hypothetical protein